jgi:hypothetical protein
MSIVTNMIRGLGIIGSQLPKIVDFERSLIRNWVVSSHVRISRSKAWASSRAAGQFKRDQMTRRAFDESMARLPIAR